MLYRVTNDGVLAVEETTVPNEDLFESDLESWVASSAEILGERLLIVGRQVELDGGKDRIDLLAIDADGSLVVIELKRDLIGGDADLQALRYAAMVSDWGESEIRTQAENYWESIGEDRDFLEETQELCGDEATLNTSQRVFLVGRDVKPRLGTMALWLIDQGVDVRVVAVGLLKDQERMYLQPQLVIPPPAELKVGAGQAPSKKPWLSDGESWHLEQRCGPVGRQIFERVIDVITEAVPQAQGPSWRQKLYISWNCEGRGWAFLHSGGKRVVLDLRSAGISAHDAAEKLGYDEFDAGAGLKEKLALGSSVAAHEDGLRVIIKSVDDVSGDRAAELAEILGNSWRLARGGKQNGANVSNVGTAVSSNGVPGVEVSSAQAEG